MKTTIVICSAASLFAVAVLISDVRATRAECNSTDDCSLSVNNAANADSEGFFDDGSMHMTWDLTSNPLVGYLYLNFDQSQNIEENSVFFTPNVLSGIGCTGSEDFAVQGQLSDPDVDGSVVIKGITTGPNCITNNVPMHVYHF